MPVQSRPRVLLLLLLSATTFTRGLRVASFRSLAPCITITMEEGEATDDDSMYKAKLNPELVATIPEIRPAIFELMVTAKDQITFTKVIDAIETTYHVTPKPFSVGDVVSAAGENMGSAKILSLGKMLSMSEEDTLSYFGDYYRKDVKPSLSIPRP